MLNNWTNNNFQSRHFMRGYITSCPSKCYDTAVIPLLTVFCPFMLQRLTTSWQEMNKLLDQTEEYSCEAIEALNEVLLRSLTKEYIDLLVTCCIETRGMAADADEHMDQEQQKPKDREDEGSLSTLGQVIMDSEECYPHIVLGIFNCLSWPDTSVSSRAVRTCVPIVKKLIEDGRVNEELAVYLMRSVLHGLEIHGKHEHVEPQFNGLASTLYQLLKPHHPNLSELLSLIPGVDVSLIHTYNQMIDLPKHRRFPEKKRRDLFKKITSNIIQVHTSQQFKHDIVFTELPKFFIPKKNTKMEAEVDENAEEGLAELFNPEEEKKEEVEGQEEAGVGEAGDVAMEEEA